MLYRYQNIVLQFVVIICLGVIGGLIYHNYSAIVDGDENVTKTLTKKIDDIDVSCPECTDCELTNPIDKDDIHSHTVIESGHKRHEKCPSAEEIAQAIFPGRNTGITQSGRYFDIMSDKSYELLPEYSFFKPEDAFPEDSILDTPLRYANVDVSQNDIDNSIDGNYTDTQKSASRGQSKMDTLRSWESLPKRRTVEERDFEARMSRGAGIEDSKEGDDTHKATRSKNPFKGSSSHLVKSSRVGETRDEIHRRKEMDTGIYQ